MLVVVVDTSTSAVTAALVRVDVDATGADGVEILAERRTVDARAHGELLAPAVGAVLAERGATPGDLGAIVAGLGPGPFTGLRVGLVTAAAMGQALSIPTYGVCSLDGIGARTEGTALVATDARRKEVYWAVYRERRRLTDPAVDPPAHIAAVLEELGIAATVAVGAGARLYAEALALPVLDAYPAPGALAELAADRVRSKAPGEMLTPLYLRRPDAVEPAARKRARP